MYTLQYVSVHDTHSDDGQSACSTGRFDSEIDERDGQECVVCGFSLRVDHCHIVPKSATSRWQFLLRTRRIPRNNRGVHDPRNGLLMCPNHHHTFHDGHWCVIPGDSGYIIRNPIGHREMAPYDGQPLRLDLSHRNAPFANLLTSHAAAVLGSLSINYISIDSATQADNGGGGGSGGGVSSGGRGGDGLQGGTGHQPAQDLRQTSHASLDTATQRRSQGGQQYVLRYIPLTSEQLAEDQLYENMLGEEKTAEESVRAFNASLARAGE
ncbi:uncharacterized protein EV422DRAFT_540828 [Fimicolochytrium jonesii]|uniref:uncharacterized protein n=1 Tax=Fimicolochytrium jonesii TaxID=1396493 RepID=UPI0022FEEB99|nr:uncharacterized protein EV422DRAFT_540828 [Fimicolochytrium jonesii]KAI8817753.1 hypothetical protein EV422DRAFT_540828 [Fimicolochytrium jonesii]